MNVKLKVAILESGKHQFKIANEAGISETCMSRVVNGRRRLSSEEASRLASVPVSDLYETFRE